MGKGGGVPGAGLFCTRQSRYTILYVLKYVARAIIIFSSNLICMYLSIGNESIWKGGCSGYRFGVKEAGGWGGRAVLRF